MYPKSSEKEEPKVIAVVCSGDGLKFNSCLPARHIAGKQVSPSFWPSPSLPLHVPYKRREEGRV
jgi:hypothetical protein